MGIISGEREHIVWVDVLRILACFLVVLAHCCDPFVGKLDSNYGEFLSGTLIGSFVRPCVPLFAMISGLLLLPVKMDMPKFYNKRAKRLLLPFVFWALVSPILYYFYINSGVDIISPNINPDSYTLSATLKKLYLFLFNFNYDITPLWYVYMLIGLYLFMPIISPWLQQAPQRDIKWFLRIWVVSMCIPYIQLAAPLLGYEGNGGNMGLWGVCDWNPYGMLYYFSGFLGYIVLAFYLKKFPLRWSWTKIWTTVIVLYPLGYAITAGGFLLTQEYFPGDFAKLETIWYFSGINVFMMTFSLYILIQKINFKPRAWLPKLSALTFGIFLSHFFFVQVVYDFIYPNIRIAPFFQIVLIAIVAFAISWLVVWLLSLSKVTRRFVM